MRVTILLLCVAICTLGNVVIAACIETELALSQVPVKVLTAATKAVARIELEEVALIGEGVEAVYELEGEVRGTQYEIYVTPAGEVLQVNEEDD